MEAPALLDTAPKTGTTAPAPQRAESNFGRWMALTAALLGWMFDGFEMGLFPLIGGPALNDLLGPSSAAQATQWFGAIIAVFLVGAATGGVFFGWLGDRIGRVRAMALSIFTYAVFTGLCGFATEAWHIAALRFVASLGMGGEWSLGVALVNEIWPNKSRALLAGLIGAAANLGFLMVGLLSIGLHSFIGGVESVLLGIGMPTAMVSRLLANSGWRFLMISGALPALLVFFIRLFVPESKKWEHEKARGATSHWSNGDLLGVTTGCLASIAIIWSWSPAGTGPGMAAIITIAGVAAALWGFLFPVRRYLTRAIAAGSLAPRQERIVIKHMLLGAGLAGVALLGTWGSIQWAPRWAFQLEPDPSRFSRDTRRSRLRSAPYSFRFWPGSSRGNSDAASHTPRCARDRSCRVCCCTKATTGLMGSFCSRSSSPAASRRDSMDCSPCIFRSCSPPWYGRRARDSPTISAASSPPSAVFRRRRSWVSSVGVFQWPARC